MHPYRLIPLRQQLLLGFLLLPGGALWSQAPAAPPGAGDIAREQRIVGQELRTLEQDVTRPAESIDPDSTAKEVLSEVQPPERSVDSPNVEEDEEVFEVGALRVKGDADWFEAQGVEQELRAALVGAGLTMAQVRTAVEEIQKELVERGYYLASVWVGEYDAQAGELTVLVDAGRVGAMNFRFRDESDSGDSLGTEEGRFFSQRQIRNRMRNTRTGEVFNYFNFYDDIYSINVHPDVVVDTDFMVNSRVDDDVLRREIDMNFSVEEERPIHAVVSLNNYGTEATEDWQLEFTLQHLNLTKNDDVLTISAPVSIDFESLIAGAASYSLPYYGGKGGRVTAYGGYSTLDSRQVVEGIDVKGDGWFAGFQWSHNLVYNRDHLLTGSLGVVRRYVEDQLVVGGFETVPRDATVMPYSLGLSYTQRRPDSIGGRNMATVQLSYNVGDFLGTSDTPQVQTLNLNADADYLIGRFQFARIQPVLGRVDEGETRSGQWVLFTRLEGQLASGPLIPAEQVGVGGHRTVRGYEELEFFGDDGGFVNLELRTPTLFGLLSSTFGINPPEGSQYPADRLQGVFFVDAGYTRIQDPLPSQDEDETIAGAGVGIRLAFSEYAQLRADWGFPLVETDESNSGGAGYVEFQLQF